MWAISTLTQREDLAFGMVETCIAGMVSKGVNALTALVVVSVNMVGEGQFAGIVVEQIYVGIVL